MSENYFDYVCKFEGVTYSVIVSIGRPMVRGKGNSAFFNCALLYLWDHSMFNSALGRTVNTPTTKAAPA